MSRFSLLLAVSVVLSLLATGHAASRQGLEANLPLDQQILRISPDDSWIEMLNPDGTGNAVEFSQMVAGVPQLELNPHIAEVYTQHEVQDVYVYRIIMENAWYERVGTMIEIRILTFPDDAKASAYLQSAFDNQVISVAESPFDQQLQVIDPLPAFDSPIIGWTQLIDYSDDVTGEFSGYASSVRYMAQVDRSIVSALVVGPFVDYNFDLAFSLAGHQAKCVQSGSPCEPVSLASAVEPWQIQGDGIFYFQPGDSDPVPARWIWPVTEPVRAPEVSASLAG